MGLKGLKGGALYEENIFPFSKMGYRVRYMKIRIYVNVEKVPFGAVL